MTSVKYIGMDVHTESTSIAVRNSLGKIVMEGVIETKANTILQFLDGLRGDLRVVFEEGTWATWLYDLLKSHVTEVLVCNTRKNAVRKAARVIGSMPASWPSSCTLKALIHRLDVVHIAAGEDHSQSKSARSGSWAKCRDKKSTGIEPKGRCLS